MRRLSIAILVVLVAAPATALGSYRDVLRDCADADGLSGTYSQAEYTKALENLGADLDEYTDCRAQIRLARLKAAGSGAGGRSGAVTRRQLSPEEQRRISTELSNPRLAASQPLRIGGARVDPDSLSSSSSIPAPLLALLVLAILGAVGAGTARVLQLARKRNHN